MSQAAVIEAAHSYTTSQYNTVADPTIAYTMFEPVSPISELTLVLVHGAAHTACCWHLWTAYLAQRGWRCLTLSLRGHGESTWSLPVGQAHLDDYAEDVASVLAAQQVDPRRCILIGHSLGGGVVQRYAARREVAGLVLIGSLAFGRWTQEVLAQLPGQFLQHPLLYLRLRTDPSALFATPHLARAYLFDELTQETTIHWYLDTCWCKESGAAMTDMLRAKWQSPRTSHVLLLAGRQDASVSWWAMRDSAARMRAPLVEVEAPHDVMLAGDWQSAASAVVAFAQQCQEALASQERNA